MAARAYQRGYYAVKEEGRREGRQEGSRQTKVDLMVDMLLGDEALVSRLDVNTIVDLRIRYGTDPAALRQAVRSQLGNPDVAV